MIHKIENKYVFNTKFGTFIFNELEQALFNHADGIIRDAILNLVYMGVHYNIQSDIRTKNNVGVRMIHKIDNNEADNNFLRNVRINIWNNVVNNVSKKVSNNVDNNIWDNIIINAYDNVLFDFRRNTK